jgi:5-methylcytosine-specific restriction endonuclease McrA
MKNSIRKSHRGIRDRLLRQLCCEWDWKCPYCGNAFGTSYSRKGEWQGRLKPTLEHVVPYVYSRDSSKDNLLAICQVCNLLKKDKMFKSYSQLISYLVEKWRRKGFMTERQRGTDNS